MEKQETGIYEMNVHSPGIRNQVGSTHDMSWTLEVNLEWLLWGLCTRTDNVFLLCILFHLEGKTVSFVKRDLPLLIPFKPY